MVRHLRIDSSECVGCGRCMSVCIRKNIIMDMGSAAEYASGDLECFDCGHCMAVCPRDAIRLVRYADRNDEITEVGKDLSVSYDDLMGLLRGRRSCRWFTDEKVTDDEFSRLFEAARCSPSSQNCQGVEFAVIDDRLDEFMALLAEILEPLSSEHPRIGQFCRYVSDPHGHNPFLWDGRQIITAFSEEPADSHIAMSRIELAACTMGLGGFYSLWISKADAVGHDRLMSFFEGIPGSKRMNSIFVIGHPRVSFKRTVPRDYPKVHRY